MIRILKYITPLLFLFACEKKTDWTVEERGDQFLVVDGIITNEEKTQEIRLSWIKSELNEDELYASGATVHITNKNTSYQFLEDQQNPGIYRSEFSFAGTEGLNYSLIINHEGKVYSSKARLIRAVDFNILRYTQTSNKKNCKIQWVAPLYNAQHGAMYEILLDWSHLPAYADSSFDATHARLMYYTLPSLDVSEIFAPELERIVFPLGTHAVEKRYSLTPEHAAYVRAVLLESRWSGGLFSTTHDNVPTNMSEGAIGFFGACGVSSKEFYITEEGAN